MKMAYKREEIIAGLECWLDPNSDLSCEDCAFFGKESDGGKCKAAVLREAKKLLERRDSECSSK